MAGVLERLKLKARQEVETAEQEYRKIVVAIAEGKDYPEPRVAEVLRLTDRDIADVESDVSLYRQRCGWRETADANPQSLHAKVSEGIKEREALHEEWQRVRDETIRKVDADYRAKIATKNAEVNSVADAARAGDEARQNLFDTAPPAAQERAKAAIPRVDPSSVESQKAHLHGREAARLKFLMDPWPDFCPTLR